MTPGFLFNGGCNQRDNAVVLSRRKTPKTKSHRGSLCCRSIVLLLFPSPANQTTRRSFLTNCGRRPKNKNVLKLAVKCLGCVFLFQECDKTEPSLIFMVRRSFSSRSKKPQTLAAFCPPHHAPGTPLTVSVNFVPLQTGVYCPPPPSARHAHFYPPFPPCLSACCNLILLPGLLLLLRDDSHFPPFTAKSKQLLCWLWRRRVRLPAGFIKLIRAAGPTDPPAPPLVLSSSVGRSPTEEERTICRSL